MMTNLNYLVDGYEFNVNKSCANIKEGWKLLEYCLENEEITCVGSELIVESIDVQLWR